MSKLTPGEKEILDAIREQNLRLKALEDWKYDCLQHGKQVEEYIKSLEGGVT